jgi:hypothetical protein
LSRLKKLYSNLNAFLCGLVSWRYWSVDKFLKTSHLSSDMRTIKFSTGPFTTAMYFRRKYSKYFAALKFPSKRRDLLPRGFLPLVRIARCALGGAGGGAGGGGRCSSKFNSSSPFRPSSNLSMESLDSESNAFRMSRGGRAAGTVTSMSELDDLSAEANSSASNSSFM